MRCSFLQFHRNFLLRKIATDSFVKRHLRHAVWRYKWLSTTINSTPQGVGLTPTSASCRKRRCLCKNEAERNGHKKRRFRQSAGCSCYVFLISKLISPPIIVTDPKSPSTRKPLLFSSKLSMFP